MELYSENKNYKLYNGNMLDMLEVIEKESIDSIVCDPPYELNFMNKGWDNSGIAFNIECWKQCFEVLKPGGYLLAFGGSRTYHRIACAIEDAGFEIRDTIMWLYGSGFPKSMDISKQLDKRNGRNVNEDFIDLAKQWPGWGTALKPSFEPIIVARKPFKGSCVDNVIKYGVGGINIDECRVGNEKIVTNGSGKKENSWLPKQNAPLNTINYGRFPANTILTYDETDFEEVCGGFPNTKNGIAVRHNSGGKTFGGENKQPPMNDLGYNDSGSASRYFYCAKASKKDRDEGLEEFEDKKFYSTLNTKNGSGERLDGGTTPIRKNTHPTVKPTELMQYLVRLVTPNNGAILDPFNGSGSTGKAVMYENKEKNKNYKYIGIELTEEYLPIAKARIEYVCNLSKKEKEKNLITNGTETIDLEELVKGL